MRQGLTPIRLLVFSVSTMFVLSAYATVPYDPPVRKHGTASVNVKNKGAKGNGIADDTKAIQDSINSLPAGGGTVVIPEGTYMINAVKNIILNKSNVRVQMSSKTILKVIPNAEDRAYVFNIRGDVHDVEIDGNGGQIIGDRDNHKAKTGQWGFGVTIRAAERVTVRDLKISKMWGDAISITSEGKITSNDLVLSNIVADQNRRQGLSIGKSTNLYVYNSKFINTNGRKPGYGIDIEPDSGYARYTYIVGCEFSGNAGGGIQIYRNTSNITITDNSIHNNKGPGILAMYSEGGNIARNQIAQNSFFGLQILASSKGFQVSNNYFDNNNTWYTPINYKDNPYNPYTGYTTKYLVHQHVDILSDLVRSNTVKTNYYQK